MVIKQMNEMRIINEKIGVCSKFFFTKKLIRPKETPRTIILFLFSRMRTRKNAKTQNNHTTVQNERNKQADQQFHYA